MTASYGWLPPLIRLSDCDGNSALWLDTLYKCYCDDFVYSIPNLTGRPVYRNKRMDKGKEESFWHIIEGDNKSRMTGYEERYAKISWVRAIIESAHSDDVLGWKETISGKVRRNEVRVHLALRDFSYIVVLRPTRRAFVLITAFPVRGKNRDGFRKRCEKGEPFP